MAAVHQRTPTPVDPKRRTAFIESMEEEILRAAEHLEKRHRRRAPRLEIMNGYSFSEGSGSEAGARRRRVNRYPRQLPEGEPINNSYSPPNSAPPLPITQKVPGGRNSATLPARPTTVHELFGFEEEEGGDGEAGEGKEPSTPVISPAVETLVMPASAPLPSTSQTQQTLGTSSNQPPLPSNTTEPANCNETSESPLPSPIPTTKTLFSPPPASPSKEQSKSSERTTTRPIAKSSIRRSLDSRIPQQVRGSEASNEIAATSDQAADLEVKSVPLVTGKHHRSVSLDKPPMTKEEHRHTTVARHEFRSKTDSKIHITVSSSVDKSRQRQSSREEQQLPVLVKDLQSQLKEKEEEIRELQRKHGRELKEKVEQIKKLNKDTNRIEREKWELLKRARDAAERSLHLRTQLDMKEGSFRAAQIELDRTRDELVSVKSANTSLRALLNDLRAPKSSIDVGTQVNLGSPLRRNPSIELAMTQGLSEDIDSGFERSSDFRTSTSTLGETDRFERTPSVSSSLQDVRDTTPVVTPTQEKKWRRRKPGLFGKMRRSSGKRGSTPSVDGIDMSQSSIIHGARGATPISFPYSSISPDMMDHWRVLEEFQSLPFAQWNLKAIVAWMEAGIGMGQYAAAIRERVTSGHAMLALTDSDMEKRLGISNPLHRRKFRLAIEYQRNPELSQFPLAGKIDHSWVAFEWSTDCGLPHLMETLMANLVDGRVLHSLTKEDLKRHLKIIKKSEQLSFLSGVELLRMHDFNRETIQDHRRTSRNPLYWTNRDISDWLKDIHLKDNSKYVLGTGVHGALLFLERGRFTSEHLANLLHIPHSKGQVRRHLANKMAQLFSGDVPDSMAHPPQQRLLHFSSERRPPTHLSQPSPEPFRSPSVPIPLLDPHPMRVNSLSSVPPGFPRTTSSPGFYRTSSNPSLPPETSVQQQRIQDRARLSLRESALRCVAIHEEAPLMRSLTPATLTGTTV